jgi:RimJ/RimL family protein N-acetyltransferase
MTLPAAPLRPWHRDDIASLVVHANDREVWRRLRDRFPHPYTVADAEGWIALTAGESPPLNFAITLGGEAVGGIGLIPGTDIERASAEVGYWLGRAAWGRGLATAALQALTAHAFRRFAFERLFAHPMQGNEASQRVLLKAGFALEGVHPRAVIKDGHVLDLYTYGITRT